MTVRIGLPTPAGAVRALSTGQAKIEIADAQGSHRPPLLDSVMTRHLAACATGIAAFVSALRDGAPMPVSGEDGLAALLLAEAARRPATTGHAVKIADIAF